MEPLNKKDMQMLFSAMAVISVSPVLEEYEREMLALTINVVRQGKEIPPQVAIAMMQVISRLAVDVEECIHQQKNMLEDMRDALIPNSPENAKNLN